MTVIMHAVICKIETTNRLCYNVSIMKKLFTRVVLIILTIFLSVAAPIGNVSAATSDLFFGQDHSYTVIFRGNGETITYAKLAFTNSGDTDQTDFSFKVPGATPSELAIFQMKLPDECTSYSYNNYYSDRECEKYSEADYSQDYYYSYSNEDAEYQKATYTKSGDNYKITLPTSVKANKSSALIVAYVARGYVTESWGLFKFNFQTLEVNSRVNTTRVAVDVDSDLILKGKNASVSYNSTTNKTTDMAAAAESFSSAKLDNIVGQIGSYTQLVKQAKNLSKNESFSVKGEYSANWFRLYLSSIVITVAIIGVVTIAVIVLVKVLSKRKNNKSKNGGDGAVNVAEDVATAQSSVEQPRTSGKIDYSKVVMASFISSILGAITIAVVYYIPNVFGSIYNSYVSYGYASIIGGLIFAVIAFLLVIAAFLAPIISLVIKRGWKYLIPTIVADILWFVIYAILFVIIIFVFRTGLTDYPHYSCGSSSMSICVD